MCLDRLTQLLDEGAAEALGTEPTPEHRALEDQYAARGLPAGDPV